MSAMSSPQKAASPSMHVETGSGPAFGIGGDVGGDVHVEVDNMPPAVIRSLEELLDRGFENVDHPVIDFSKPVEKQVQLFPEDYVRIDGIDHGITEVNFGGGWRPFDAKDHYLVWGTMGQPVVPQFKGGRGGIKLEVRYRNNLDKPRALQFGDLPTRR
jgi:hypothetical protein